MQRVITGAAAALIAIAGLSTVASAETTAEDAIKYRQAVMEVMGGHMAALALIALNKVDGAQYLASHADGLADASAELDALFPAVSASGETDAMGAIWDNPEQFAAAVAKTQEATQALQAAAASGDRKALMGAFATVGKACKGCHENYRAEHDHDDSH